MNFIKYREQLKKDIDYIWPPCSCGCGKQNYGWGGNLRVRWKLTNLLTNGADKEELKQHFLRDQLRQRK